MRPYRGPMLWEEAWDAHVKRQESRLRTFLLIAKDLTPIEKIAFLELHELTLAFGQHHLELTWQKKIGKYTVDFALTYQPLHDKESQKKIIVECDGHEFHEKTKEQVAKGKERDRFLVKEGYTILHYSGSEIVRDSHKIFSDIEEMLIPEDLRYGYGYGPVFEKEMKEMFSKK